MMQTDLKMENCGFYVIRKKRYCKMLKKPGNKFCGEHGDKEKIALEGNISEYPRVPCPYDNKHTCYLNKLESHMSKCISKPKENTFPYIIKNLNILNPGLIVDSSLRINSITDERLEELIRRMDRVLIEKSTVYPEQPEILRTQIIEEEITNPSYGPSTLKHLIQNSSLIAHLKSAGLDSADVYVEFGSGRGQLTYWLTKVCPQNSKFYLIDKASQRHKFDNKLKDTHPNIFTSRVKADISDLDLSGLIESSSSTVGVSKHLCGGATDLALACMNSANINLNGFLIALCCHHRCTLDSYVGRQFLKDNGFKDEEFNLITGLTSWATCGTGKPRNSEDSEFRSRLELSLEERENVGRRAKKLLDLGRLNFIKKKFQDSKLLQYVDKKTSLENVCLIAKNISL